MTRWAVACDGRHQRTLYMVDQRRYPDAGWWTDDPEKMQRFQEQADAERTVARLRHNNPRILPCK